MTPGKPPDAQQQALLEMVGYLQERAEVVAALDQRMIATESSLRKYDRILTDGNGQPSVLAQIVSLQSAERQHTQELKSQKEAIAEMSRNAAQMKRAVASSVIAALTAILVAILSRH